MVVGCLSRSLKLQPTWSGPYDVVKRKMDVVYEIQLSKISKIQTVHFNRLKNITREGNYDRWLENIKDIHYRIQEKIWKARRPTMQGIISKKFNGLIYMNKPEC